MWGDTIVGFGSYQNYIFGVIKSPERVSKYF
jgi:hypothetical protein